MKTMSGDPDFRYQIQTALHPFFLSTFLYFFLFANEQKTVIACVDRMGGKPPKLRQMGRAKQGSALDISMLHREPTEGGIGGKSYRGKYRGF
jgi:hypothetical protein